MIPGSDESNRSLHALYHVQLDQRAVRHGHTITLTHHHFTKAQIGDADFRAGVTRRRRRRRFPGATAVIDKSEQPCRRPLTRLHGRERQQQAERQYYKQGSNSHRPAIISTTPPW